MKKHFVIIIVFIFIHKALFSQNADEINRKIDQFSSTIFSYPDSAYTLIKSAYRESLQLKDPFLTARSTYNLGYYYYVQSNISQSRNFLNEALQFSEKSKNYRIQSLTYNLLGQIEYEKNQYSKALQYYFKALTIAEQYEIVDSKSRIYINLGNLYLSQKDTIKSIFYNKENIENATKNRLNTELVKGYMNLGIIFTNLDRLKAINYYQSALKIIQKTDDIYTAFNLHLNLSDLYLKSFGSKDIQNGYKNLKEAEKIQQKLQDEGLLYYLNYNWGGYYRLTNQDSLALLYYQKALKLVDYEGSDYQKLKLYKTLYEVHYETDNYKDALHYNNLYKQLSDSIFTIEKNKTFEEIQTKYDLDKKNLQIKLLTQEKINQKNKNLFAWIVSSILFLTVFISILFFRNKVKNQRFINLKEQEIHKQEIIRLEQEKEIKRITGLVEGQNSERNRIAKEIHDGVGGALAGIKLELSQINSVSKNEKLNQIIEKLSDAFTNLRQISHNLSSHYFKNKTLDILLHELKQQYEQRAEFEVFINIFPENALQYMAENTKQHLYRVFQEVLTNISKHAKADKVEINITQHDNYLNILVEDNGVGYSTTHNNGIGLQNIEERLALINAQFDIESYPQKGTTININIET